MRLIKTVKGEEAVMDFTDEVLAVNLLRTDKRYRLAEDQVEIDPDKTDPILPIGGEVIEVDSAGVPIIGSEETFISDPIDETLPEIEDYPENAVEIDLDKITEIDLDSNPY